MSWIEWIDCKCCTVAIVSEIFLDIFGCDRWVVIRDQSWVCQQVSFLYLFYSIIMYANLVNYIWKENAKRWHNTTIHFNSSYLFFFNRLQYNIFLTRLADCIEVLVDTRGNKKGILTWINQLCSNVPIPFSSLEIWVPMWLQTSWDFIVAARSKWSSENVSEL